MFAKKSILTLPLSLCLIYASSAQAEPSFTKKYAPYLGYEGGYSSYQLITDNETKKYTPRFFAGFRPIQKRDYQIGFEAGYTLPASFEENYYNTSGQNFFNEKFKVDVKNNDLYLTFRQLISGDLYWFLNPGLEYMQRDYKITRTHFSKNGDINNLFISTRAGIGYNFNSGFGINFFIKYRIHDFNHAYFSDKKLLIKLNAQYTF